MRNRIGLIAGAGLLALLACLYTYKADATDTFSRAVDSFREVDVETKNGAVVVSPSAESVAQIQIVRYAYGKDREDAQRRLGRIAVMESVTGEVWHLRVDFPASSVPQGANVTASLPENAGVNITTSNGRVFVAGINGGVTVITSNGSVEFTGTGGDGYILTTNADVHVRVHEGGMTVNTSNGEVECDLSDLPAVKSVSLNTSNGKVVLSLPPDVSCRITASTNNGTVVITGFHAEYEEQSQSRVRARIGSGAASVTVTTTNGDILIQNRNHTTGGLIN